jgi:plasmid stabilization system protein ParE
VTRFSVAVLPEAEAEAREALLWYFERSPLAADAFRTELFRAIDVLAEEAADWPTDEDGVHRYHLKHFPYTVMYEISESEVTVLAVAHQRRRPRYWQER